MKTYFLDIISKLQNYSQKLDDLTMLTNQHWVVVDEISNSKNVYIFRANNELLISQNGRVEKAKWEYLGNDFLIIERKEDSYLFKNGFLDENILALKVDGKSEYALLVNENRYEGELNSIEKIAEFLKHDYLDSFAKKSMSTTMDAPINNEKKIEWQFNSVWEVSNKGKLEIRTKLKKGYSNGDLVFIDEEPAPDGEYVIGWPLNIHEITINDGKLNQV